MEHEREEMIILYANGETEDGETVVSMLIFQGVLFHWIYIEKDEQLRLVHATFIDKNLTSSVMYFGLAGIHQFIVNNYELGDKEDMN